MFYRLLLIAFLLFKNRRVILEDVCEAFDGIYVVGLLIMSTKRKRLIETVGNTTPLVGTPVKKRKGRCSLAEKNRINEEV